MNTVKPWRVARAARKRRVEPGSREQGDLSLVTACAVLGACLRAGLDVTGALMRVGEAAGDVGLPLVNVAEDLRHGLGWDDAWTAVPVRLAPLARVLRPAWQRGSSPVAALDALARSSLATARTRSIAAAAELGVRLTAPLSLCLLPAFIAVGIVPLLVAVGSGVVGDVIPAVASIAPAPSEPLNHPTRGHAPAAKGEQP